MPRCSGRHRARRPEHRAAPYRTRLRRVHLRSRKGRSCRLGSIRKPLGSTSQNRIRMYGSPRRSIRRARSLKPRRFRWCSAVPQNTLWRSYLDRKRHRSEKQPRMFRCNRPGLRYTGSLLDNSRASQNRRKCRRHKPRGSPLGNWRASQNCRKCRRRRPQDNLPGSSRVSRYHCRFRRRKRDQRCCRHSLPRGPRTPPKIPPATSSPPPGCPQRPALELSHETSLSQ